MLSEYLSKHQKEIQCAVSENERSFAIWQEEKLLAGQPNGGVSVNDVLRHCNITRDELNIYRTAEPLAYYSHSKKTPQNILILENLDPFYGMRKFLLQGQSRICGMQVGTLVYGGGKRVPRAFSDFDSLAEPYLADQNNSFYYVGDIDYEGIRIYEGLFSKMKTTRTILPCIPIYIKMLDCVRDVEILPVMKEKQHEVAAGEFLSFFPKKYQDKICKILAERRYVPQEILSVLDYK